MSVSVVKVRGAMLSGMKVKALARRLRQSPRAVLDELDTARLSTKILAYVEKITPKGPSKDRGEVPLGKSWKTERTYTQFTVRLELFSILAQLNKRSRTRLYSVERGNRQMKWVARHGFSFQGTMDYQQTGRQRKKSAVTWAHIAQGTIMNRPARPGLHILDQVREWLPLQTSITKDKMYAKMAAMLRRATP